MKHFYTNLPNITKLYTFLQTSTILLHYFTKTLQNSTKLNKTFFLNKTCKSLQNFPNLYNTTQHFTNLDTAFTKVYKTLTNFTNTDTTLQINFHSCTTLLHILTKLYKSLQIFSNTKTSQNITKLYTTILHFTQFSNFYKTLHNYITFWQNLTKKARLYIQKTFFTYNKLYTTIQIVATLHTTLHNSTTLLQSYTNVYKTFTKLYNTI